MENSEIKQNNIPLNLLELFANETTVYENTFYFTPHRDLTEGKSARYYEVKYMQDHLTARNMSNYFRVQMFKKCFHFRFVLEDWF